MNETIRPADSTPTHWSHRLPPAWRPFAQLSRLDRPIGWRLLLAPCWMGLALARTGDGLHPEDALYALAFVIGAVAMRGAGCTFNDIVDRDIDAKVARTRARPLPSGAVTAKAAWGWLIAQCLIGLVCLAAFAWPARITALAALPIVAAYPFMKRITWWPQAWLGLAFSWGALTGVAAVTQTWMFPPEMFVLYAGCIAWVIAYDTIYALQDMEDDALIGVRSTARLFGAHWRSWTGGFYLAALILWALAAGLAGAQWPTFAALGLIGALLIWPLLRHADPARPEMALAAFKQNAWVGLAVAVAFALEPLSRTLQALFNR
ncbi:MAG: 4-hydroxybenzoate octaprenyltransferase [Hyphomonadaceae bacterium]